jgi:hypothetical protein
MKFWRMGTCGEANAITKRWFSGLVLLAGPLMHRGFVSV